jgi:hypothetical protein
MNMSEVIALLQQQQKDLAQQRQLLEAQSREMEAQSQEIAGLKRELDGLHSTSTPMSEQAIARSEIPARGLTPETLGKEVKTSQSKSKAELEAETSKLVAAAQIDDPAREPLTDFKGAWRLPGTDAALRIGGYVKTSIVHNFDALKIQDQFIVGSIPVTSEEKSGFEAQSSITASQSRLNFDLREPTDVGLLRAFIEGDFTGDGDTFRLRHAFGQWHRVLAGKTWSAFVDNEASPEEIDFEGLNGRIKVRQSQVRIMPRLGKAYEFQLSLEDPNPQVQNGEGVNRFPDIVTSVRFQPNSRLHLKLGLLGRQIRAQRDSSWGAGVEEKFAWGSTLSGRFTTPLLGERDSLLFQFNAGNGIGRYVNDLSSVGNYDGIFNTSSGELELFDILAGYVSWQHWWGADVRSNFTLGAVEVDNPDFVDDDAYKRTLRFSSNLLWTPTPRVDLGAEYLWGNHRIEDGQNGDATQIQFAARYRF